MKFLSSQPTPGLHRTSSVREFLSLVHVAKEVMRGSRSSSSGYHRSRKECHMRGRRRSLPVAFVLMLAAMLAFQAPALVLSTTASQDSGEKIKLETVDALKPAVLRSDGDDDFLYLLMPVRVS